MYVQYALAVFFKYAKYAVSRKSVKVGVAAMVGIVGVVIVTVVDLYRDLNIGRTARDIFIAIYITLVFYSQ